jgi:hypothetical protein
VELQGWRVDPWLRHEARYFSDGQPTGLVRDGEHESTDPPPSIAPLVPDPPPAAFSHEDEVPEHVYQGENFERKWGGSLGYARGDDPGARDNWVDRLIIPVFTFLRPSRFGDKGYSRYVAWVILGSLVITLVVLVALAVATGSR